MSVSFDRLIKELAGVRVANLLIHTAGPGANQPAMRRVPLRRWTLLALVMVILVASQVFEDEQPTKHSDAAGPLPPLQMVTESPKRQVSP